MTGYSVGILVVSDSCFSNLATDQSGINLREIISNYKENQLSESIFKSIVYSIVPDNIEEIKKKLIEWSDELKISIILTTGGTGFAPTDVTPEATKQVIQKEASSLTNVILMESMKKTKFAMLSRATCGIRNKTIILNLPGSKKGSQEALEIVLPVLKHALDLINDVKKDVKEDHQKIQQSESLQDSSQSSYTSDHKNVWCHHHNHHHKDFHSETSRLTEKEIVNRPRKSTYPMISVEEAIKIILDNTQLNETEEVYYLDALNRITSTSVYAKDALPPFAASVKDGFAVKLTEQQLDKLNKKTCDKVSFKFEVIGSSNAGDDLINVDLKQGQCIKINTGAPVPLKADAVIQIEDTISIEKDELGNDRKIEIIETSSCGGNSSKEINIKFGQDIRPIGFDIKIGEEVVREFTLIKSAQIGICATVGALNLKVFKLPTVGLISTGNELKNPDDMLSTGKIRDSNKSLLYAALKSFGIHNIFDAGIANDDPNNVLKVFKKALEKSDIVISTGGVSMGDKDLVKDVLEKDLNGQIHFARMNMKPGKPTTFATCEFNGKKKLLFCLPGNPVSAIVTFNLVVMPCLKKMIGYINPLFTEIKVKCEFEADLDPRPEYHRCNLVWPKLNDENSSISFKYPSAYSTGNQHSSRLLSMNEANCLVKLPGRTNEKKVVTKGEILTALIIEKI